MLRDFCIRFNAFAIGIILSSAGLFFRNWSRWMLIPEVLHRRSRLRACEIGRPVQPVQIIPALEWLGHGSTSTDGSTERIDLNRFGGCESCYD